ncbi:MAG TPA: SsrA-binding protein SmpB [Candidatus Saccharimonadales bacterium]|nr:SsrA-binding protein SmpB [Candidatus Saccharimonadales bacterium]
MQYHMDMKITNKRASFDYELLEHFEAGINLLGAEVKAIKLGHADLTGSHVRITGNELFLINAKIFPYKYARPETYDESRTRKLLMHRQEITALRSKMEGSRLTIVPVSLYTTRHNLIKAELALARGKKQFDKRKSIKKKDLERDTEVAMSVKN